MGELRSASAMGSYFGGPTQSPPARHVPVQTEVRAMMNEERWTRVCTLFTSP